MLIFDIKTNIRNISNLKYFNVFEYCTLNILLVQWSSGHEYQFFLWINCFCTLMPYPCSGYGLISKLADYIQKRRGEPGLFSFEHNLLPKLIQIFFTSTWTWHKPRLSTQLNIYVQIYIKLGIKVQFNWVERLGFSKYLLSSASQFNTYVTEKKSTGKPIFISDQSEQQTRPGH